MILGDYVVQWSYIQLYVTSKENFMKWTTPSASDMRYGFEISMYIANR